jgi:hypothetical protein
MGANKKIVEGSVMVTRARLLLAKMREVAAEVRDGRLRPGSGQAMNGAGEPVCAFGHAVCRAAQAAGVTLVPQGANYPVIVEFLDGDYEDALDTDEQDMICRRSKWIERANDRAFLQGHTPDTYDRESVASTLESVADSMGAILLPRPPEPDKGATIEIEP